MFKKRKKLTIDEEQLEVQRISFRRTLSILEDHLNSSLAQNSEIEKIKIISFILDLIKRDIQAYYSSAVIYNAYNAPEIHPPFPSSYTDKCGNVIDIYNEDKSEIDLASTIVITCPWRLEKYFDAIRGILHDGFEYIPGNQSGMYYLYLDLGYIENGIHHASVANSLKTGKIKLVTMDITKLFGHVYTDGMYWYNTDTQSISLRVWDVRCALLYTLCEMKYNIEMNLQQKPIHPDISQ